jgi:putative transposase
MDWFTRKVLAWRISNTLEAEFCLEARSEAIHKFGPPEIMNTDHPLVVCRQIPAGQRGAQFTSFDWTDRRCGQRPRSRWMAKPDTSTTSSLSASGGP